MPALLAPVSGWRGVSSWRAHMDRYEPSSEPGVDLYVPIGTQVVAPADGVIWGYGTSILPATGRWVGINFDNGMSCRVMHLSRVFRTSGRIDAGAAVGLSGASGYGEEDWSWNVAETGGAHVHFTLWPTWDHRYDYRDAAKTDPYTIDPMLYFGSGAGGNATDFLLEDDMPTMHEFLNTPAYTGGPTISEFFKAVDQGGVATQVWNRTVDRGLDANGNPLLVPAIQELADAKTLAMQLLGQPVGQVNVDVDEAALAASLAPLITSNLSKLSDGDVARIAEAAANEGDRRARERLNK